jgi:hypothetical protein
VPFVLNGTIPVRGTATATIDLAFSFDTPKADTSRQIDRVVIERKLSTGEYIHEQKSIMTIAQVDPLNVELILPLDRYGGIKIGALGVVHPARPAGGAWPARVGVVDPVIDAASDTFGVRLLPPNPDRTIPAGIRCTVEWRDDDQAARRCASDPDTAPRIAVRHRHCHSWPASALSGCVALLD